MGVRVGELPRQYCEFPERVVIGVFMHAAECPGCMGSAGDPLGA